MWWAPLAAAAIPAAVGMFQKRPSMSGGMVAMPQMPDRTAYIDQMLQTSFDPNSEIYQIAAEQLRAKVNQQLAQLGLMNSSYGINASTSSQAELARKFIEDAANRQRQGLGLALDNDRAVAEMQMGINTRNADNAYRAYLDEDQRKRDLVMGVSGLAGAGLSAYGNYQQAQELAANRVQQQENFNRLFPQTTPSGAQVGVPYGSSYSYGSSTPRYGLGVNYGK